MGADVLSTNLDHITLAQILAVAAVAGLIWTAVKKVLPGTRRAFRGLDEIVGVPGDPDRPGLLRKVEDIHHQVFANSGESLRDQVDQVNAKVDGLITTQQQLLDAKAAQAAAIEQLASRFEEIDAWRHNDTPTPPKEQP